MIPRVSAQVRVSAQPSSAGLIAFWLYKSKIVTNLLQLIAALTYSLNVITIFKWKTDSTLTLSYQCFIAVSIHQVALKSASSMHMTAGIFVGPQSPIFSNFSENKFSVYPGV